MCRLFNLLCLLHLLHRCFENLSLLLSHALLLGLVLLHPFLPPLLPLISLALTTPLATLLGHETRLPFVSLSAADNNHYSVCLLAHPELSSMPLALRFNCLTNFDAVMANAHFSHLVETGLAPRTVDLFLHVSLSLWYLEVRNLNLWRAVCSCIRFFSAVLFFFFSNDVCLAWAGLDLAVCAEESFKDVGGWVLISIRVILVMMMMLMMFFLIIIFIDLLARFRGLGSLLLSGAVVRDHAGLLDLWCREGGLGRLGWEGVEAGSDNGLLGNLGVHLSEICSGVVRKLLGEFKIINFILT
jgi:hypothetical protein